MVLESRHLIGIFLLLVVIFGVVFTLGYLLGRSQYDARLRGSAETASPHPASGSAGAKSQGSVGDLEPAANPVAPAPSDWDYYKAPEPKAKVAELKPPVKTAAATAKPSGKPQPAPRSVAGKPGGPGAPLIPRGATVLQVAALTREGDALALAQALQQKKFPAFVLSPKGDSYYRVQVGPYADAESANIARRQLESQGFKSIIKR